MMTKKIIGIFMAVIMIAAAALLTACQSSTGAEELSTVTETVASTVQNTEDNATEAESSTTAVTDTSADVITTTANTTSNGKIDATDLFSDRDLRQTADLSEAVSYTVEDGKTITINTAGVYVISGSAQNAQIIVEAGDEDKVQLVLSGVTITNTSTPAIYVKNADKVFVTTASGTNNSLSVTGTFTADGTTNTDAVIFSKDDLILNGLGTLTISSSDNGISGKDDIKITGGTITINSTSDAIEANESIAVADGNITIKTDKDGLHAENDEDTTTGYIYICGGTFKINADSDGIRATTVVQIDGGTFDITSSEGIEGTYVQINGGDISVSASDDGLNATSKSTAYTVTIEINGGSITIDMGQGDTDAIDSNGNLYINGGELNITAQSPFDYDGEGQYNGGTMIVNGSQTTELTNQMMGGGMGGPGNMGGPGDMNNNGNMGGNFRF